MLLKLNLVFGTLLLFSPCVLSVFADTEICVGCRKNLLNAFIPNENTTIQLMNIWTSVVPEDRGGFLDDILFVYFNSDHFFQDSLKRFGLQKTCP